MNPDILALIDKAKNSLGAARILIRDGYFDFAASRAYYAMFYIAEAMLLQLGLSYSKHSAVISAFGQKGLRVKSTFDLYHFQNGREASLLVIKNLSWQQGQIGGQGHRPQGVGER